MSERPTVTRPPITKNMPNHLNQANRARRKIVERIPVKMITAPRNIWNDDA